MLIAVLAAISVIAVTALAPRAGVAAPLLLVVVGIGVSLLPAARDFEIEPEIILAGVLPALLYAAAASFPAMDFRRDFGAISGLSVLLVVISAGLLGAVFSAMIPGIDLAAGIALGAIVSPTDAVATSIIKKLGAPPRVVTVLDGEGLLNDATSLVLLRSAIVATAASVSFGSVLGRFALAVLVAVVAGALIGVLGLVVRRRLHAPAQSTAVSFVIPFAAYWPAESLHGSGIVAAVTAGLVTSSLSARFLTPQDRMAERVNWRTVEVLLEGGLFLVMGLQFFPLVTHVRDEHGSLWLALGVVGVGAVGVLVIRVAFVFPLLRWLSVRRRRGEQLRGRMTAVAERLDARLDEDVPGPPEPAEGRHRFGSGGRYSDRMLARIRWFRRRVVRKVADIDYLAAAPLGPREGVVLVWAGMRGVVTLAAAQTLPADFPQRAMVVLVAFGVAAGTLLVQGGTLPWVIRGLGLAGVGLPTERQHAAGLHAVVHGAADALLSGSGPTRTDGTHYDPQVVAAVRATMVREEADSAREDAQTPQRYQQMLELRLATIHAQRSALLRARDEGQYDSALLSAVLDHLDADQIALEIRMRGG